MNLTFEISEQEIEVLDNLVKELALDSYKDLFNNSLTFLKWGADEIKNGKVIASVDEDAKKYTELQLQAFSHLSQKVVAE